MPAAFVLSASQLLPVSDYPDLIGVSNNFGA